MNQSKKHRLEDIERHGPDKRIALQHNSAHKEDEYCDRCKNIDWVQLEQEAPLSRSGKVIAAITETRDGLERARCRICKILALLIPEQLGSDVCQLKALSSRISFAYLKRTTPRGPLPPPGNVPECTVLYMIGARTDQSYRRGWHQTGCLLLTNPDNEDANCGPRDFFPQQIDYCLIKQWMAGCKQRHSKTCVRPRGPFPGHLRVIDCQTKDVVTAPNMCQYVALSYVWGPAPEDSGNNHAVSPVVEDSIAVTLALGFRYLWIDKHCIDQDSPDKQEQIERMDLIYSHAELTIVAAAGDTANHGLPGVGRRPRKPRIQMDVGPIRLIHIPPHTSHALRSSTWATRGWTYQESILSRRRLIFTDDQVSFVCNAWHQIETADVPPEPLTGIEDNPFMGFIPKTANPMRKRYVNVENMADFQEIKIHIMEYSSRRLTHDSDALNAILSIFESTQAVKRRLVGEEGLYKLFYHLHGLPIKLSPGPDTALLPLVWYHTLPARRRSGFPSWSWSGWEGAVRMIDPDVCIPRDCVIEVLEGGRPVSLASYIASTNMPSRAKHSIPTMEMLITAKAMPITLQSIDWGDLNESFSQESQKGNVRFLDGPHVKLPITEKTWAYVYAYLDDEVAAEDELLGILLGAQTSDKVLGILLLRSHGHGYERAGILRYRNGRGTEAGGTRLPHIVYVDEQGNFLDDIESVESKPLWLRQAQVRTVKVT